MADVLKSNRVPGQVSIHPDTQVGTHGHDSIQNAGHDRRTRQLYFNNADWYGHRFPPANVT